MEEIWKDIPKYEGYYQISNKGQVRSVTRFVFRGESKNGVAINQRVDGRPLSVNKTKNGYLTVVLNKDGHQKRMLVHRIVAMSFIPNPLGLPEINHKDGNRTNDKVDNLEWCNRSGNILHASRILHTLTYHGKSVRCVETGEVFPSIRKAAVHYGVADTNIRSAIIGMRQHKCAGYHWELLT